MARPKKEQPNHGKYYEEKVTVSHELNGTPIRKSFYSKISKADAKRKAQEYIISQKMGDASGAGFVNSNVTFSEYAKKWLPTIKGTVKDNTYNLTYINSFDNHLIPYFGKAILSEIRQIDVQLFFTKMSSEKSLESLKKYKICLNGIFKSAVDNHIIPYSPVQNIKLTSNIPKQKKRVYSEEDVERILKFAKGHRFGLEIQMLLRLGLRRGELLAIQWEDFDFNAQTLYICRAVTDIKDPDTGKYYVHIDNETKTEFSERLIPLPSDLSEELQAIKKNSRSTFVFVNAKGNVNSPDKWSKRHYKKFMEEMRDYYASLENPIDMKILAPHELRHTCTSLLVNADKNLYAIASVLGWRDLKMLREKYAHEDMEAIREMLDL